MNKDEYQQTVSTVYLCARMLAQYDLNEALMAIEMAETFGPITAPNAYRDKADAMREDKEALKAALRLQAIGERLNEQVKDALGIQDDDQLNEEGRKDTNGDST